MSDEHPHALVTIRATNPRRGPFRIDGDWRMVNADGVAMPLPERKDRGGFRFAVAGTR